MHVYVIMIHLIQMVLLIQSIIYIILYFSKLTKLIKKAAPEGIDAMYDNSGEEVLDAVLPAMNKNGFIVLCGATATYYTWKNRGGLKNVGSFITK